MNKVILIGRLTRDPELRYTQNNRSVCNFTLACDRGMSKAKRQEAEMEGRPTADFIRCTAWGTTAELANRYLDKGSQVAVEGRLQVQAVDDGQGGKTYYTDVNVDRLEFVGSRSDRSSGGQAGQGGYGSSDYYDDGDVIDYGGIPF